MKKRFVAFLLVLIMVLGMLPVSAFAADDGVSPQALNTGHKIDVTFTVLYVGNEFNIGYNYGTSEKTQFVCQYSTPHSDTAYNNHTIAISDIKAAADRATVNSGYQIVGWSKEANANPKTWGFDLKDPTACNKGTTIYLVAKNPNPNPTYMYYLYYKYNDGTNSTWLTEVTDRPTEATTFTFYVNGAKLKDRRGYEHIGWADKADAAAAKYTGGEPITLTKDDPAKTIYAVWMPFFELKYDANGGTGAPDSQTRTASHPTVNQVTFTVRDQIPTKEGCTFKGWADSATATDAQYQPGGKVTVKHADSPKTVYAVWEESAPQPPLIPVPSYDDLKSAIGKIQVKDVSTPSCGTENYDLIDNTQSDPFNWTKTARADQPGKYDVTIKTAPYVAKYNSEKTKTHELNNANQTTLKLVISYENNKWVLDDGLRVIEVKHSEQNPPTDIPNPNPGNIAENLKVKVVCTTPNSGHEPAFYSLIDGTFTHTDVDQSGDYPTCSITISPDKYISRYSTDKNCQHTTPDDPKTVPLFWNKEAQKWAVNDDQIGLNGVVFNAVCEAVPDTFTVTYTDGVEDEVIFENDVHTGLNAGDATPAFVGGTPTREGYVFLGWEPEVAETVTANATYTATWEEALTEVKVTSSISEGALLYLGSEFKVTATANTDAKLTFNFEANPAFKQIASDATGNSKTVWYRVVKITGNYTKINVSVTGTKGNQEPVTGTLSFGVNLRNRIHVTIKNTAGEIISNVTNIKLNHKYPQWNTCPALKYDAAKQEYVMKNPWDLSSQEFVSVTFDYEGDTYETKVTKDDRNLFDVIRAGEEEIYVEYIVVDPICVTVEVNGDEVKNEKFKGNAGEKLNYSAPYWDVMDQIRAEGKMATVQILIDDVAGLEAVFGTNKNVKIVITTIG